MYMVFEICVDTNNKTTTYPQIIYAGQRRDERRLRDRRSEPILECPTGVAAAVAAGQ